MREKQPPLIWTEELLPEMRKLIYCRRKTWKRFYQLLPIHLHTTFFFKKEKKASKITFTMPSIFLIRFSGNDLFETHIRRNSQKEKKINFLLEQKCFYVMDLAKLQKWIYISTPPSSPLLPYL